MTYEHDMTQFEEAESPSGKPRILIMGEFSVGKSTLCNLILGEPVLPTQVTATRLPPVWISKGDDAPNRMAKTGVTHPVDLAQLDRIHPEENRYIRLYKGSDLLDMCDLIDMPGISDPSMSYDGWGDIMETAQALIWCTHATQAWRQSEAAMWNSLPEHLKDKGILLLTRFDKLINERDRKRVITRIERETAGQFRGLFPISLTDAMEAGEDPDLLRAAGAEQLAHGIVDLLTDIGAVSALENA